MTVRKPAVIDGGNIRQLREGDTIPLTAVNNLQARLSDLERQLVRQSATMYFDFKRDKYIIRDPYTLDVVDIGFGVLDFSRSTSGGVFNSAGNIEQVAIDVPRFTYNRASGLKRGILIEAQRTNLFPASDSAATYLVYNSVPGFANTTRSLSGTSEFDLPITRLTANNLGVIGAATTNFLGSIDTDYVVAGFVRPSTPFEFVISTLRTGSGANSSVMSVNPVTGEFTLSGRAISGVADYIGDGWWYVWVSRPPVATSAGASHYQIRSLGMIPAGEYLEIAGAMAANAKDLSSYIPTSGSAVTRAADFLSRTLGSEYNPDEGTIRLTTKARAGDTILTLGSESIIATSNELETYTLTYDADPGATELVFGPGIHESLFYYPEII